MGTASWCSGGRHAGTAASASSTSLASAASRGSATFAAHPRNAVGANAARPSRRRLVVTPPDDDENSLEHQTRSVSPQSPSSSAEAAPAPSAAAFVFLASPALNSDRAACRGAGTPGRETVSTHPRAAAPTAPYCASALHAPTRRGAGARGSSDRSDASSTASPPPGTRPARASPPPTAPCPARRAAIREPAGPVLAPEVGVEHEFEEGGAENVACTPRSASARSVSTMKSSTVPTASSVASRIFHQLGSPRLSPPPPASRRRDTAPAKTSRTVRRHPRRPPLPRRTRRTSGVAASRTRREPSSCRRPRRLRTRSGHPPTPLLATPSCTCTRWPCGWCPPSRLEAARNFGCSTRHMMSSNSCETTDSLGASVAVVRPSEVRTARCFPIVVA